MRIGVDATCWQNSRGYGRHARSLLTALVRQYPDNQYTFYMDSAENSADLPTPVEVHWVHPNVAPTTIAASANGHRSPRDMWRMSRSISTSAHDVLLFPTIYSFVPSFSRAKKLVMIHDVIAETYPELTLPKISSRLFWRTKVALGRCQADAVVTVSEFSRKGIIKHFKMNPQRIEVVGEASDPVFRVLEKRELTPRLASLGIDPKERLIIYVGGFSPHKNLETLVSTFASLSSRSEFSDVRLVMVGEFKKEVFHSYFGTIKQQVEDLQIGGRTIFAGYLPDDELVSLLNLSTVFVLPSLLEGFGLPAVEAAACGCPVIATSSSPLPTLLGEGGLYFDPNRSEELERALREVLTSMSLREQMSRAAIQSASLLTWDAAARQMMDVMQRVVQQ